MTTEELAAEAQDMRDRLDARFQIVEPKLGSVQIGHLVIIWMLTMILQAILEGTRVIAEKLMEVAEKLPRKPGRPPRK